MDALYLEEAAGGRSNRSGWSHSPTPILVSSNTEPWRGEVGTEIGGQKENNSVSSKMSVFPFQHKLKWYHAKFVAINPLGSTTESSRVKAARYGTLTQYCQQHPRLPQASAYFTVQEVTPFERPAKGFLCLLLTLRNSCLVGGWVDFLFFGLLHFCHCLTHQLVLKNGLIFKSFNYSHLHRYKYWFAVLTVLCPVNSSPFLSIWNVKIKIIS